MIAGLKPYPEYRDSGVLWLGEVPAGWELKRAKWLFSTKKEPNTHSTSTNVLSLTLRGVVNNDPGDPEGLVPKDYRSYQLFSKGDLVFKLIDLENLKTSRVGLVHEDGIMSPAYVRLIPRKRHNNRFFYHQFYDLYSRGVYNQLGVGVRSTLGARDLLNLSILVPSAGEQTAIVRYLDYIDRRTSRYIRAKRTLIALLEEQKQAIIQRAVTRGLDPSVRLKPSGVEWMGDVPEHWEVLALKRVSRVIDGDRGPEYPTVEGFISEGIPFLSSKSIRGGRLTFENSPFISQEKFQALRKGKLRSGDIVITVRGTIGNSALFVGEIHDTAFINAQMMILRPNADRILPAYLLQLIQSTYFRNMLTFRAYGSAQQQLTNQILSVLPLPVPPPQEQSAILDAKAKQTAALINATHRAEREITLLREYRTRVIADVVTGKLDVRQAAANLPDDASEREGADWLEGSGVGEVEAESEAQPA